MLPEFGLINMRSAQRDAFATTWRKNGRLYDPQIGRFLSTDNYVQEPWDSQNFNRYSYCLNNPLKYTDPSGEIPVLAIIGAIVVSGGINVAANWDEINSWEQGLSLFGVGAASAAASIFVSPVLGAIVAGAGNSIVNQGFNAGWGNIDYGNVMVSTGLSVVTYAAGGKINKWLEKPLGKATSWIKNDILRATAQDAISGGIGGLAIGTGLAIQHADDFEDGLGMIGKQTLHGAAIGGISGFARGLTPIFSKSVDQHFDNHAFSHNRHADIGVDNLTIKAKVKQVISDNRNILHEGENTIKLNVNGIPKLIRVNIFNNKIRSYNFMPCNGVIIRSESPIIYLQDQNW